MSLPDLHEAIDLLDQGRSVAAIDLLERLTDQAPAYAPAWAVLAQVYEAEMQWEHALNAWHATAYLVPGSLAARLGRARVAEALLVPGAAEIPSTPPEAPATSPSDLESPTLEEAAVDGTAVDEATTDAVRYAEPGTSADAPLPHEAPPAAAPDADDDRQRLEEVMRQYLAQRTGSTSAEAPPSETDDAPEESSYAILLRAQAHAPEEDGPGAEPDQAAEPETGWVRLEDDYASVATPLEPVDLDEDAGAFEEDSIFDFTDLQQTEAPAGPDLPADAEPDAVDADDGFESEEAVEAEEAPSPMPPGEARDDLDRLIEELNEARIVPMPDFEDAPAPELEQEIEDVVSETLARIYAAQRQYDEAARVYEMLAVQHPDRHDEFTAKARQMRAKAPDA